MSDHSPSDEFSLRSRRQFLAGVGASIALLASSCSGAGNSALSSPPPTTGGSGSSVTPPGSPTDTPASCSNVVNLPSPDPWFIRGCCTDTVCGYNAAEITVTGVRHYCGENIIPWGDGVTTNVGGNPFPARPDGAFFCLTIYPIVDKLLKRNAYAGTSGYDDALAPFFKSFLPRDMVSCWHEVANVGGKSDADGTLITAADEVAMQQYLLEFRNKLGLSASTGPAFGAIECPQTTTINGAPDNYGIQRCGPFMMPGLDFYGQDLYDANFSDPTEPLQAWENTFGAGSSYSPNATIAVCECNSATPAHRPDYYNRAAYWLWNQKNTGARSFLTFWNYSGQKSESGAWLANDTATIAALQAIGNGEYVNP